MLDPNADEYTEDGRRIVQLATYLDGDGRLTCPDCGCQDFSVERTLPWTAGAKIRERECTHCGRRLQTREVVDE